MPDPNTNRMSWRLTANITTAPMSVMKTVLRHTTGVMRSASFRSSEDTAGNMTRAKPFAPYQSVSAIAVAIE